LGLKVLIEIDNGAAVEADDGLLIEDVKGVDIFYL